MIAILHNNRKPFRTFPVLKLAERLIWMASHVQLSRYKKHPRGPKKPLSKKTPEKNGGHVSIFKLINRTE
jgi:hypothetical protein